jgi:hypothetical protein
MKWQALQGETDESIHEYLTRGGATPLNHYFVMDGEVREWKPSVGFSVGIRYYDDAFGAQCREYLVRQGLTCEGRHQIRELAERYGWLNWGKMMLKLSPPPPAD